MLREALTNYLLRRRWRGRASLLQVSGKKQRTGERDSSSPLRSPRTTVLCAAATVASVAMTPTYQAGESDCEPSDRFITTITGTSLSVEQVSASARCRCMLSIL